MELTKVVLTVSDVNKSLNISITQLFIPQIWL